MPSARLLAPAALPGYRVVFRKRGRDGSGKCDLVATGDRRDLAYGAVYTITGDDRPALDACECLGCGYDDGVVRVDGLDCFTYFAQPGFIDEGLAPFHWYKRLVLSGARYLGFPAACLADLDAVVSVEDPDSGRRERHARLLSRIAGARPAMLAPLARGSG